MDVVADFLEITAYVLIGLVGFSMVRVVIGPSPEDRMIGLNMVSGNVLALLVVLAVKDQKAIYLDVALVYAILGYIGTLLLARRWERGSS
jgi:multicomponent Na+:H+ antiporter subunit F